MTDDLPRRSRMSAERRAEVFGTVRELLSDVGYERLTFDAVASGARTSKATLYRKWGSKSGLVLAALSEGDARHAPLIQDAGSLDDAFAQLVQSERMSEQDLRMGIMLVNAASADPDFAAGLRRVIIAPGVEELAAIFEAAADRGEIVRDSPLFARLAYVILTDLAFFPLLSGHGENRSAREELFRTVVRPALEFRDHESS